MKLVECVEWVSTVKRDHVHEWPGTTLELSPHKPFLLLAIVDLFNEGEIVENSIVPTKRLFDRFSQYWNKLEIAGDPAICLPFWHLKTDGYWNLIPNPGMESQALDRPRTDKKLRDIFKEGRFDRKVYAHFSLAESREFLRIALINSNFRSDVRSKLKGI